MLQGSSGSGWPGFEGDGAVALVFYDRKIMYQWRSEDLRPVGLVNFVVVSKPFSASCCLLLLPKKTSGPLSAAPKLGPNGGTVFFTFLFKRKHGSPAFGSVLRPRSQPLPLVQAAAFFRWVNLASREASADRPPLFINMDETALVRHPTRIRGYVAKFSASQQKAVDRATLGDRRTCMSYFACVTHDAGVQGQLPQVVLGNERQVSKALLDTVASKLPANMVCWRLKSSWNSHETMRKWLSLLAKSLGNLVRDRTVILLVDVNPSHIHQSIFVHARRCGIRLVYVPAKLTAYLQPCDTHVFAKFKRSFRDIWRERRSNLPGGVVTDLCWLEIVFEAIQTALATASWRGAFLSTGILEQQRRVSNRLRGAFGFARGVEFGDNPLTAEEASAIFPKRSKADHLSYVLWQPKSHRLQKERGQVRPGPVTPPSSPKRRKLPPTFGAAPRTID